MKEYKYGLLRLEDEQRALAVLELNESQLMFTVVSLPDDEAVSRYLKQECPLAGTFIPGYRVALHLSGSLNPTFGSPQPDAQIEHIVRVRKEIVEWLRTDMPSAWAEYIEPYKGEGLVKGGPYALDVASGRIMKELEKVNL